MGQLPHHLPCGIYAALAIKHGIMLRTLFYVFIVLHKVVCIARTIEHTTRITYQSSCLVNKCTVVAEEGVMYRYVDIQLVADVTQDSNVKIRTLRPKAHVLIAMFFFEIFYPLKEVLYSHFDRSARQLIAVIA